jgi:hypothetical protein
MRDTAPEGILWHSVLDQHNEADQRKLGDSSSLGPFRSRAFLKVSGGREFCLDKKRTNGPECRSLKTKGRPE